ncbi:MAG: hypothetical protein AAF725_14625, partial [Acidobacteriota bacterium]
MLASSPRIPAFCSILVVVFLACTAVPWVAADESSPLEVHAARNETGGATPPPPPRHDAMSVRTETRLGTPQCVPGDIAPACWTGPWLETRAWQFVNIRKTTFIGQEERREPTVPGTQMSSSFVAQQDGTEVAISFTAEAYVAPGLSSGKRLFVRALVDGVPAEPSNVVFATDAFGGTRSFTFTTRVDR